MENIEVWKDVVGYEGIYQVSNLGNVKSLSRIILRNGKYPFLSKEKLLKINVNKFGYSYISLENNGEQKYFLIHRLVGIAFILNNENKSDINHINGVKTDNIVNNLEWNTRKENIRHSVVNGLTSIGEKHYCAKLTEKQVLEIRESNLKQKDLAVFYKVNGSLISSIKTRKKWKHI